MSKAQLQGRRVRCAMWMYGMACGLGLLGQARAQDVSETRTLDEVLAIAHERSPLVIAARARLGLGQAARADAEPWLRDNPELELGAGPRTHVGDDAELDFKVRLQQRIEVSGQRSARMAAARATTGVEDQRLRATYFAVRVSVRAVFHAALLAREQTAGAREAQDVQARVADMARKRLQTGDIGPLGVRLAEADLAQTNQARIEAEANETLTVLRLCALVGLSASPHLTGRLPKVSNLPNLPELIAQAHKHQPLLKLALAELELRERRAHVAARETWAGPTLGVELSHEDGNQNIVLGTVSVPLPLFARNRGERAQLQAERNLARAELDTLDQALPLRVQAAFIAARAAEQRIAVYGHDVLPRLRESLDLIGRAFELGELDAVSVSNARAHLIESQHGAWAAQRDYLDALTELETETGLEFSVRDQP